jgi:hypothetical protein
MCLSALDHLHNPPPQNEPQYQLYGGWMGLIWSGWMLWRREKCIVPARNQTAIIEPIMCHYTN